MDEKTRNDLLVKLVGAKRREAVARELIRAHAANIEQIRNELGNPYFYSGRPAEDPESEAKFTGWTSHEPAFRLWQEWQDISRDMKELRQQLREVGIDPA